MINIQKDTKGYLILNIINYFPNKNKFILVIQYVIQVNKKKNKYINHFLSKNEFSL